ncbi:hypothetical protein LXA43DRAFT_1091947 [Ganoderma leucocontextum]|nr:hypothetical protein LXA43DRAFT_1091947 [Ganoderma leucocontextum]
MPLFGKHKHDNNAPHETHYDPQHDTNVAGNQQQPATRVGEGYGANPSNPQSQQGHRQPHPNQYNAGMNSGSAGYAQDQPLPGNRAGIGAGASATGTSTGTGVPPASHINTSADASRSGGGARLEGKAERAVGSLVGSQALKERGVQKEQEAGAFKMQSSEIAEAERLEKEALMHRERAVAHGAHPDNRHLGGMQNATTLSDVAGNQTGSGGSVGSGGY